MNTGKQYERLQKEFTLKMRSKMHAQTFANEVAAKANAELNHRPEIFRLSRQLLNLKDQHYNSFALVGYHRNTVVTNDEGHKNKGNHTLKRSLQGFGYTAPNSSVISNEIIAEKAWKLLVAFPTYSIDEDPNFIVSMRLLKVAAYFRGDFLSNPSVATRLALQHHLLHTYRMEAPQAAAFASILPYISYDFTRYRRDGGRVNIVSQIGEQNIRISPFVLKFKQNQKSREYAFENKDTVRESEGVVVGEGDEEVMPSLASCEQSMMSNNFSSSLRHSSPLLSDVGDAFRILAPRLKQLTPEFTPHEVLGITQSLYNGGSSTQSVALSSCSVSVWNHHEDVGERATFSKQGKKQNNIGKLLRDLDCVLDDEIMNGADFSFTGSSIGHTAVSPAALLSELEEGEGMAPGHATSSSLLPGEEGTDTSTDNSVRHITTSASDNIRYTTTVDMTSKRRQGHQFIGKSSAIESNNDKSLQESLLYALSRAAIACEDHDDPHEIAIFLHTAAKISPLIGSAHLIAIRNRLRGMILDMDKKTIVILCRGIAKTRTCDRRLMGDLGRRALSLLGDMKSSEIADILHAFHMTSCRHEPLLKRCAARQVLLLEEQTIFTASLTIAALSHFHVKESMFYQSLGRGLYRELRKGLINHNSNYSLSKSAAVSFTAAAHSLARVNVFVPELFLEPFDGFVNGCVGGSDNYDHYASVVVVVGPTKQGGASVVDEQRHSISVSIIRQQEQIFSSIVTLLWSCSVFGVGGKREGTEDESGQQSGNGSSDIINKKQARHINVLFGILNVIIKSDINNNNININGTKHQRMLMDAACSYIDRPYDIVQKQMAQEVFELVSVM